MSISLTPNISAVPYNSNVAFNNSWIAVDNDQNRSLFAQATTVLSLSSIPWA